MSVIFSAALLLAAYGETNRPQPVSAATTYTCGDITYNGNILLSGQTATSGTTLMVSDEVFLEYYLSNSAAIAPTKVVLMADGRPLGRAKYSTTNLMYVMPWQTTVFPDREKDLQLSAEVTLSDGQKCLRQFDTFVRIPAIVPIKPLQTSIIQPIAGETIGLGASRIAASNVVAEGSNGQLRNYTEYAEYEWSTNSPNSLTKTTSPFKATFVANASGPSFIRAEAMYGGVNKRAEIPITVGSSTTALPDSTTTSSGSTSSGSTSTSTNTSNSTTATTQPATTTDDLTVVTKDGVSSIEQYVPETSDCLKQALSEERFRLINSGQARPTQEELAKLRACFSAVNYILPSNFSPVDPLKVKELPTTKKASVSKLENVKPVRSESKSNVALQISGTADPNTTILLYVFSNPLVLTTTTDSYGNWTYTLEDPLEAGDHEVYTVVDRGNGVYERSAPVSFVIASAEASAEDGEGVPQLSLRLADTPTPGEVDKSLLYYLAGAGGLLIIVVSLFFIVLNWKHHKHAQHDDASDGSGDGNSSAPDNTSAGPSDSMMGIAATQGGVSGGSDPEGSGEPEQPAAQVVTVPDDSDSPDSNQSRPLEAPVERNEELSANQPISDGDPDLSADKPDQQEKQELQGPDESNGQMAEQSRIQELSSDEEHLNIPIPEITDAGAVIEPNQVPDSPQQPKQQ